MQQLPTPPIPIPVSGSFYSAYEKKNGKKAIEVTSFCFCFKGTH